jgi:archaetidylinositol phosphate synthase
MFGKKEIKKESIASSREKSDRILEKISRKIPSFITPDGLTIISLLLAFITAAFIFLAGFYQSRIIIFIAGIFLALSSLLDALDGNLARIRNVQSKSGDYLDHSLDRVADLVLILAVGFGGFINWPIVALAVGGVSLTSNFGALSKTVGLSRNYGGFGRVWRLFIMIIVLILSSVWWSEIGISSIKFTLLGWMTILFAAGGYYTAIKRFFDTQKKLKNI